MFDCATAAFMNRRSRMADVMATVPTAAQAARRMKSRRVKTENCLSCIKLFLDDVVGRTDHQMNDGANTVAHLRLGWYWRGVRKIRGIGDVADDPRLCGGGQLARDEQRVQIVHERGNAGVGGIIRCHPRAEVKDNGAIAASETAQAIRVDRKRVV